MTFRKRRSHRSGRAPLLSPGRPPEAKRSELQRFWLGIARGMASESAALEAGISQLVGARLFRKAGGMPPSMFRSSAKPPSGRYLSFAEREGDRPSSRAGPFDAQHWSPPTSIRLNDLPRVAPQRRHAQRRAGVSCLDCSMACRAIGPAPKDRQACAEPSSAPLCRRKARRNGRGT